MDIKKQLEEKSFILVDYIHFRELVLKQTELVRLSDVLEILAIQVQAVSDDFGDIMKFLNKVNNKNRTGTGTPEEAHFDLTADGGVTLTIDLSGVRPLLLRCESIKRALQIIRQNSR